MKKEILETPGGFPSLHTKLWTDRGQGSDSIFERQVNAYIPSKELVRGFSSLRYAHIDDSGTWLEESVFCTFTAGGVGSDAPRRAKTAQL